MPRSHRKIHSPRPLRLFACAAAAAVLMASLHPQTAPSADESAATTAAPQTPERPDTIGGIPRDSIPGTTEGLDPTATLPDMTRRDFHPNCFENGCHKQMRETRWLHGPVAVGACQACHVEVGSPEKHKYEPTRPKTELCIPCHKPREPRAVRHEPFAESDCMKCHDSHGGQNKSFLRETSLARLCKSCHDGQEHDGKVIAAGPQPVAVPHEPAKKGDCAACHAAHQSDHEKLLVRDRKVELCIGCHRELIPAARAVDGQAEWYRIPDPLPVDTSFADAGLVARGKIPSPPAPDSVFYYVAGPIHGEPFHEAAPVDTVNDVIAQLVVVHKPLTNDCAACHRAHGSDIEDMLTHPPRKLCDDCHGEKLTERIAAARSEHGRAYEEDGCSPCHVAHTSRTAHLLRASSRTLCLDCHEKSVRPQTGPEIPSIQDQLSDAVSVHQPVREGCVACHRSHASDQQKLLRGPYPEDDYARYARRAYEFCYTCHDPALIEEETGTRTGFRNGAQNLHYLHVHRAKGRTCDLCHAPHAGAQPMRVPATTPFGPSRWSLFIDYEKTSTGGSCSAGCHRRLHYDREKPVELQPGEPLGASGR